MLRPACTGAGRIHAGRLVRAAGRTVRDQPGLHLLIRRSIQEVMRERVARDVEPLLALRVVAESWCARTPGLSVPGALLAALLTLVRLCVRTELLVVLVEDAAVHIFAVEEGVCFSSVSMRHRQKVPSASVSIRRFTALPPFMPVAAADQCLRPAHRSRHTRRHSVAPHCAAQRAPSRCAGALQVVGVKRHLIRRPGFRRVVYASITKPSLCDLLEKVEVRHRHNLFLWCAAAPRVPRERGSRSVRPVLVMLLRHAAPRARRAPHPPARTRACTARIPGRTPL